MVFAPVSNSPKPGAKVFEPYQIKVMKFGGSSLATAERYQNAAHLITQAKSRSLEAGKTIVVVSASGDTTDILQKIALGSLNAPEQAQKDLTQLIQHHLELANALVDPHNKDASSFHSKYQDYLATVESSLRDLTKGISLLQENTLRSNDAILSYGERLSAPLLCIALLAKGVHASAFDASNFILAEGVHGAGTVPVGMARNSVVSTLLSDHNIAVVTGFIAKTAKGATITLGRGGSDYSASVLASCCNAGHLEIWTDVDGMMTADPRKVDDAFRQQSVSYAEALELCHFGAYVLFPPAIRPAMEAGIPLTIRNTLNPDSEGTTLVPPQDPQTGTGTDLIPSRAELTGISSIPSVGLILLEGNGMIGVEGIAGRTFTALSRAGINIILITQASSEHSICLAVAPDQVNAAVEALGREFAHEIERGAIECPSVDDQCAIISAVGDGMRATRGIAGRIFTTLGANGVNVKAIAQGSSERNISMVIDQSSESRALNALHSAFFFPERSSASLFIVGTGLIGSALLEQLQQHAETLSQKHHRSLKVHGLSNSKSMILTDDGLQLEELASALNSPVADSSSIRAANLEQFVEATISSPSPGRIFVDCTASLATTEHYPTLLANGVAVVTPNKKAQSASLAEYRKLMNAASRSPSRFLYETSVGAGLPIISVLQDLLQSGDTIISLEAVLSGTLSYLFNTFDGSVPFSQLVQNAQKMGYTEPDPREDLNGLDVGRKILILAREAGAELELADIEIESLISEGCAALDQGDLEAIYRAMAAQDDVMLKRYQQATSQNKALRYCASFETGKASVGLKEVGADHPLYGLEGSDNMISFRTKRYDSRPLVVRGPGAGAEVTAAGVFADILKMCT